MTVEQAAQEIQRYTESTNEEPLERVTTAAYRMALDGHPPVACAYIAGAIQWMLRQEMIQ